MNTMVKGLEMECLSPRVMQALERADSRNYDDGTLKTWLCDRYEVSYHTPLHKIIHMVINELCS
jgi:hypothetical protein